MGISARVTLRTAIVAVFAAAVLAAAAPGLAQAACSNPVACENELPGTPPSDWKIGGDGDPSLVGFGTKMSVRPGDTIGFKIKAASSNFRVDILRLGYYGGDGARKWATNLAPTGPTTQPACNVTAATGLIDCGNWSTSLSWTVPANAVSGVYIAHMVNQSTGADNQIIFVVRSDTSHSDVVVQTSDSTWQAYNDYGGNSLYVCSVSCPPGNPEGYKAAFAVSYNRPLNNTSSPSGLLSGAEYSMIRWLEQNGYDASYVSSGDVATRGSTLLNHKLFISSGHDEYWSASQRTSMEAARDAGVNMAFFSGNEGFWKTRWSTDTAGGENRILTSYKDSHFNARTDPVTWTGAWRDSRFTTPADNATPANALTGQEFLTNAGTSRITVPAAYGKLRLWRSTAAASLTTGQSLTLAPGTLGYEWDVDADNGFRPAGTFRLSSTTATGLEVFTDYATNVLDGQTATHNMTMYRAPSGALVFGAGTVQWAWGLSDWNPDSTASDRNMRQATSNLFADMGAQPTTRDSDLTAATKSTDTTKPTSTITTLPASASDGTRLTIGGTAADTGGVVGGVEISTDNGATWHPATTATAASSTTWSYSWVAHGAPSTTIRTRATDDSGNTETPGVGRTLTVNCPCSLFGETAPAAADSGDGAGIEVGMKFTADSYGTIGGMRFYKAATNTGSHVGSLWSTDGTLLARATFSSESASGWQTVTFSQPIPVQNGQTYIVSYFAPNGHYSATPEYFYNSPAPGPVGGALPDGKPLHAVRNTGGAQNGVFNYGTGSTFPTTSFEATNYWVDPVFTPQGPAGNVTSVTAAETGPNTVTINWSAPTSGGIPATYVVTPYIGSTAQTPKTVTAPATSTTINGLTAGTSYRFTVKASNPSGNGAESPQSNAVTPTPPQAPSAPTGVSANAASQSVRVAWTLPASDGGAAISQQTVTPYIGSAAQTPRTVSATTTSSSFTGLSNGTTYTFKVTATNSAGTSAAGTSNAATPWSTVFDLTTPTTADCGDGSSLELGVRFKADNDGAVTGIRFYKAAANTGTHTGSLWTANGTRLAQATFTNEDASGWQSVTFADPVPVNAGTTYVASYFAPNGHYACTANGLTSAVDNGPLHALANSTSAPNGLYVYSGASQFPSKGFNASNYWVDVMYGQVVPGQVTGVDAQPASATSATVTWNAPTTGGPVTSYKITPYAGTTAQTSKTVAASNTSTTITGLTTGTAYTFKVTAINASGSGPESAASGSVTPVVTTVPGTPSGVVARPATSSALVSWTVPSTDGGRPISGQTVTPYIGTVAQTPKAVSASASSTTVTGLTNGESYTFKVNATNSNGDGDASAASNAVTPRLTIFEFADPDTVDGGDGSSVELGVKFTSDVDGEISGIRFYKASTNTGTHIGSLWTAGGTRLAQVTFSDETGSGWQSATFSDPVSVTAGTTYVASYFAPNGHYSVTGNGLAAAIDNAPLHAVGNATSPNGLYGYGSSSTFPSGSFNASNYSVDVLFRPTGQPGQPTGVQATAGNASANVSWTAPGSSGGTPTSYKVTPHVGSSSLTPTTVTGSPLPTSKKITALTPGTSYTFTVQAVNAAGGGQESAASNAVVPTDSVVPGAPTGVTAQADSGSAVIGWTAPTDDGGSSITGYSITPYLGSAAQTPTTAGASDTSVRVTGLTRGSSYRFTVRAQNSKGLGAESAQSAAVTPAYSIFAMGTPANADANDSGSVVLGTRFSADSNGSVTGARFYKGPNNKGTHIAGLWNSAGTLLRSATFSNETGSGWQTVTFSTPVSITANSAYIIGYLAPQGHYSTTAGAFTSLPFDSPPLHAFATVDGPNGVYLYSSTLAFPTNSWNATNYWADVLFVP